MSASRAGRRTKAGRGPGRLRAALTSGDRPFVLLFALLVAGIAVVAAGPLQVFTAAAERLDELEAERDELRDEVDELEERERRLEDPDEIDLLARSELGLVMPDEDPIVVVPDPEAEDEVREQREAREARDDEEVEGDDLSWWRRLGRWLGDHLAEQQ